jgi:urease subunit beta/urease subunit gamma/beta
MKPGEYLLDEAAGPIQANPGRRAVRLLVKNTGDRPIQVGSHYHFFEANRALEFDRAASFGMRLNIAAGTAVRFEPGEEKESELTDFGGAREIHGGNGLVEGSAEAASARERAVEKARKSGFRFSGDPAGGGTKR